MDPFRGPGRVLKKKKLGELGECPSKKERSLRKTKKGTGGAGGSRDEDCKESKEQPLVSTEISQNLKRPKEAEQRACGGAWGSSSRREVNSSLGDREWLEGQERTTVRLIISTRPGRTLKNGEKTSSVQK